MTSGGTWQNWSGRVQARPVRVAQPANTEEVAETVLQAARAGLPVKAVGSGHSFSEIAVADGVQVLGDIDRQTIAGATSTGTHGTGVRFGGISTQIRALRLVLADGTSVRCDATQRPDLFAAARVGLGALGIVTEVTLQCEPLFALHTRERSAPLDQTLEELPKLVEEHDHFEFFWFPHTSTALTKSGTRLPGDAERRPTGRLKRLTDDFLANGVFGAALRAGARVPKAIPAITRAATAGYGGSEVVDHSYRVFPSNRGVRFNESEFAVPRAAVVDVLREMRRWVDGHDEKIAFPFEVRFAAPDDIWMSTAYQRESAYIAFHQYHRMPHQRFFAAMEAILREADGRPHWGKMHDLGADHLRPRYPRFDDFVALRDDLDPAGVFGNAYLDRVLGPRSNRAG